jgi:hypothetical protein
VIVEGGSVDGGSLCDVLDRDFAKAPALHEGLQSPLKKLPCATNSWILHFAVGDGHKSSFLKGEQRENDAGGQPPFKYPMGLARKRIEAGGWTRQVTIRDFPLSKKMAGVQMRLIGSGVRELHWPVGSEWAASSMFPNTRRLLDIRLPTDSLLGSSDRSATARIAQSPLDPRGHVRRDHQAKDAHQRKSRSLCTAPVNPGITKSRLMLRGEPSCSATPFPSPCTK